MTGGRIKRLEPFLEDETFMVTYGDGVADVDVNELVKFHRSHGKIATVTAVRPPARFGELLFNEDSTVNFSEKPQAHAGWIKRLTRFSSPFQRAGAEKLLFRKSRQI